MCTRISLFFAAVAGNVCLQDSGRHIKCQLFLPDFKKIVICLMYISVTPQYCTS